MSERPAKYLSIRQLRPALPGVIRDAAATSARYVVTRRGKPEAVLLGLAEYERLLAAASKIQQKHFHQLLKEGYLEMAEEDRATLKTFEHADRESLKYLD